MEEPAIDLRQLGSLRRKHALHVKQIRRNRCRRLKVERKYRLRNAPGWQEKAQPNFG